MKITSLNKRARILKTGSLAVGALMLIAGITSCSVSDDARSDSDKPLIAVTTSILGDVVSNVVGDEAEVVVLMPAGADPHNYQPPSKQVSKMMTADLIVENGLGLEAGIASSLKAAEADGVPIFTATDHIEAIPNRQSSGVVDEGDQEHDHGDDVQSVDVHGADQHNDDAHEGDAHDDHDHEHDHDHDHDHDHGPLDPHFWHDPLRMKAVVIALSAEVTEIDGLDADKVMQHANAYADDLEALNERLTSLYGSIAKQDRQLVTGHRVFAYLADQYGLDIVGSIIPSSSTLAETNAADLMRIADSIKELGVKAIFTDSSQSQKSAQTVVEETGLDLAIVALHSESLTDGEGEASTYIDLMQSNANKIVEALNS